MFVLKCQINFYKLDPGQTVEKLNIYLQVKYSYIKQYKQSTEIGNPPPPPYSTGDLMPIELYHCMHTTENPENPLETF